MTKYEKIIQQLSDSKQHGSTIVQAKAEAKLAGFPDDLIAEILEAYPYQSLKNEKADIALKAYYLEHPKHSKEVGESVAEQEQQERAESAMLDAAAGEMAPDVRASFEYQDRFLNKVGIGWPTWIGVGVLLNVLLAGLVYVLHLPLIIAYLVVNGIYLAVIWFVTHR